LPHFYPASFSTAKEHLSSFPSLVMALFFFASLRTHKRRENDKSIISPAQNCLNKFPKQTNDEKKK
jgi:hypothetical protein